MTTLDGWAIGTGAMMGVAIFVVSGQISGVAGPAACLGFFIAAAIVMVVALCYCEVSAAYPIAGGAYIFPRKAIGGKAGELLSFISGWCLWGGQGLGPCMVSIACASYISFTCQLLGFVNPIPEKTIAIVLVILFGIANMRGSGGGKLLQLVSTLIIAAIMVTFIIWGGLNVKQELLAEFAPKGFSSILSCAAVCIFSFSGWSSIPAMSEEFVNPGKQVPKSIIYSLVTCGLIFTAFVYIMNGLMPGSELAVSSAPPADAFSTVTKYGGLLTAIGGIFACVSTGNGLLMTGARIPYSMSRHGDIPKFLGKVNSDGIPYVGVILTVVGQLVLVITGAMSIITQMTVFVTSLSWIITIICLVFLREKHKEIKPEFRAPAYPIIVILASAALIFMLTKLNMNAIKIGSYWIAGGVVIYYLFKKTSLKMFCEDAEENE